MRILVARAAPEVRNANGGVESAGGQLPGQSLSDRRAVTVRYTANHALLGPFLLGRANPDFGMDIAKIQTSADS